MKIHVEFCEAELLYLLAEAPTGVTYGAQCGGMYCDQKEAEGAIIAAAQLRGVGDLMCDLVGCYISASREWTSESVATANAALREISWEAFTDISELRMDEERLVGSVEGWWYVRFTLSDPLGNLPTTEHRGVLFGPNCD